MATTIYDDVVNNANLGSTNLSTLVGGTTQTAGLVLTANGNGTLPTMQASGSGALVHLDTQTASNSASLAFTNTLSSTYDNYFITIENGEVGTTSTFLQMQIGTGAGPSYDTTAGHYVCLNVATKTSSGTYTIFAVENAGATAQMFLTDSTAGSLISNIANWGGHVYLFGASSPSIGSANMSSTMSYTSVDAVSGNHQALCNTTGTWTPASPSQITSLKFTMSSGNISTGTFKLYGIQN